MLGFTVRKVVILCVLGACTAGSYWLIAVSDWFRPVTAVLCVIVASALLLNGFEVGTARCPHCSQSSIVIGSGTHTCNSCKGQFTL